MIMGSPSEGASPIPQPGRFTVGRDAHGSWVVCDRLKAIGGIFVDRASAIRFARRESNDMPGAIRCAPDSEVLDVFAMLRPAEPRRGAWRMVA